MLLVCFPYVTRIYVLYVVYVTYVLQMLYVMQYACVTVMQYNVI